MHRTTLAALVLSTQVSGCCAAYDMYDFGSDFPYVCDKLADCSLFTEDFEEQDCRALSDCRDTGPDSCEFVCEDYDCQAAKACIRAYEHISCEDYAAGVTLEPCTRVCSNHDFSPWGLDELMEL